MQNSIGDIVKFRYDGLTLFGTIVEICEDNVFVEDDFHWKYSVKWEDISEADDYEHNCYKNRILGMIENLKDVVYNNARTVINAHQGNYEDLFRNIMDTLLYYYQHENQMYENMKEEGLTLGAIEVEGAVRVMKTIINTLKEWDDSEVNRYLENI